jgi:hypothetical protein
MRPDRSTLPIVRCVISNRRRSLASPAEAGSPPDEVAQPRPLTTGTWFVSPKVANRGQSEKIRARCLATADMKPELHAILIGFAIGAIAFSLILVVRPASALYSALGV